MNLNWQVFNSTRVYGLERLRSAVRGPRGKGEGQGTFVVEFSLIFREDEWLSRELSFPAMF